MSDSSQNLTDAVALIRRFIDETSAAGRDAIHETMHMDEREAQHRANVAVCKALGAVTYDARRFLEQLDA